MDSSHVSLAKSVEIIRNGITMEYINYCISFYSQKVLLLKALTNEERFQVQRNSVVQEWFSFDVISQVLDGRCQLDVALISTLPLQLLTRKDIQFVLSTIYLFYNSGRISYCNTIIRNILCDYTTW